MLVALGIAATVLVGGGHATAAPLDPKACSAIGQVFTTVDPLTNVVTWTLSGKGQCSGDLNGPYIAEFSGSGTSQAWACARAASR